MKLTNNNSIDDKTDAQTIQELTKKFGILITEEYGISPYQPGVVKGHVVGTQDPLHFVKTKEGYKKISEKEFIVYSNSLIILGNQANERVSLGGKRNPSLIKLVNGQTSYFLDVPERNLEKIDFDTYNRTLTKAHENVINGKPARKGISFYNNNGKVDVRYNG